jgi:hypothetical protein
MISADYKKLRMLALRPSLGIFGILAWFSVQSLITSQFADRIVREAIGTYVTLTVLALMVWGFAGAIREYRQMGFAPESAEGRYLGSSKTFAFVMNIVLLSFIFLGGFTVFAGSIFGMVNGADFVERLIAPCRITREIASTQVVQIEHPRIGDLVKLPHPINRMLINRGNTVFTWRKCIQ